MAALSSDQVYALARQAGANHDEAVLLTAIAKGESSWDPGRRYNPSNTTEDSYGLWQINMDPKYGASRRKTFGITSNEALYDPLTNARAAVSILRSQGWNAWTIYKNGSYKKYLGEAQAAGARVGNNYQEVAAKGRVVGITQNAAGTSGAGGGVGTTLGGGGIGTSPSGMGGPGVAPSTTLPPNASPAEVDKYIRENYPQAAGFLDVPEIRDVLIKSAQEGWTPTKLQAEIQATNWWRTNGASTRELYALKNTDPAEYQRAIDRKAAELGDVLAQTGVRGDGAAWAEDALKYGWTDEEVKDKISASLIKDVMGKGLKAGSSIDVMADDILKMARNEYLVPISANDAAHWALEIFDGRKTEAQIRAIFERQAYARFPGLANSGVTPGEYLAPIRNVIAEALELNPADVDLLDRQFSAVLENDTGQGLRPMTISEAQRWARSQKAYRYTKGARDESAQFAEQLTGLFGGTA